MKSYIAYVYPFTCVSIKHTIQDKTIGYCFKV